MFERDKFLLVSDFFGIPGDTCPEDRKPHLDYL